MSLMQQHTQQRPSVAAAARAAQQHSQQQQPQPTLPQQPQRQRQPFEASGGSSSVFGGNSRRGRRQLHHDLLENAAVRKWVARAQEAEDEVPDGGEAGDEAPPEPCGRLRVPAASSPPPQIVEETGLRHIHVTLMSSTTIKDVELVSPGANSAMGTVAEDI